MAGSPNRGAFTEVNSPLTKTPTEQALGFDPRGPGHFGAFLRDPMGALIAEATAQATDKVTAQKYPGMKALSDEAGAYRHTLGSHVLSRIIGDRRANAMGDAHEIEGLRAKVGDGWNSPEERAADLYNNHLGRVLPGGAIASVEDAMRQGYIRKKPFGE